MINHFKFYNKQEVLSLTKTRRFETKLGERIQVLEGGEWPEILQQSKAKYVLFGIPEDLGVRANGGDSGAETAWIPFLQSFLNIQSNDFLPGENILLLGHFDFGDIKFLIENNAYDRSEKIEAYRKAVEQIDDAVEKIVKAITVAGKIPIAIGGGHNNAYPMIKGSAKGLNQLNKIPLAQINAINLDAHSDYRPAEGRHSGNGFRYAEKNGYLGKYAVIGLHENYIQQNVLMDMHTNPFVQYSTFEEIFIWDRINFIQAVAQATGFTEDSFCGIELDVDAIEYAHSSAITPCGLTPIQARKYLNFVATDTKVAYLHIAEGASILGNGTKNELTGKLISYLVTDFIKAGILA